MKERKAVGAIKQKITILLGCVECFLPLLLDHGEVGYEVDQLEGEERENGR